MPLFFDKSYLTTGKQLQQSYRFVLRVKGIDAALIKDVSVPSYTIETKEYDMLEHSFKYPMKVKWNGKVEFTIVEVLDEEILTSTLGFFMSKLYNSSFYASPMGIGNGQRDVLIPNSLYNTRDKISSFVNNGPNTGYQRRSDEGTVFDLSKQKLSAELGIVQINTLDAEGNQYDCWRLNGAFIAGITPTNLTYDNEELSTIKVELSYDWASYGFRGVFAEEDAVQRIIGL